MGDTPKLNAYDVCSHGVTLSKDIIRFFPTFTLHDETHIANVCNWMIRLLGERKTDLSAAEAALLIMSACCHDIGMSVSDDQKKALTTNAETIAWKEYFKNHLQEDEIFSETKTISPQMLRNFIRTNHHKRISEQISVSSWPQELKNQGITRQTLVDLCQSHGESLESLKAPRWENYDLRLCAVLLRLSDILDFDSSRAPLDLFKHLGLQHPENFEHAVSQTEWAKNRSGVFGEIRNDVIPFTASFTSLQLECEVQAYLEWVQQELDNSAEYLSCYAGRWQTLTLPRKVSTDSVERMGYHFGKFHLTMDQNRVLELLTGRNLYSDPGVFVRELLQNSIDAVRTRSILDPHFQKKDGKIIVHTWMDSEGYSWFRIEDNGTGMNENIITNYFLKVGCSYYTSDEFRADKRHYGRGSDYTPISRFGIGILSCFMSDPKNTLLEVSTKRYSQDPMSSNPAIRLNVTGLNGYYYLAQEKEQDENDEFFLHMHHPQNRNEGYRYDVGTTICVRVNLFQLGNYRSFKEILDKYVQFPEVTVEYRGQEGHIVYPTQDKLMDAVHKLNPDGPNAPLKKYVHAISDEQFKELKSEMHDTNWTTKPSIVLQYCPLDWFSDNDNVNGFAIFADINASASTAPIEYEGAEMNPVFESSLNNIFPKHIIKLIFSYSFSKKVIKKINSLRAELKGYHKFRNQFERTVWREYPRHQNDSAWIAKTASEYCVDKKQIHTKYIELQQVRRNEDSIRKLLELYHQLDTVHTISISYDDLFLNPDTEEAKIFRYITDKIHFTGSPGTTSITAYNGILSDTMDLLGMSQQCICYILLLRDNYCPEVDLARDTISNLPLETACELSLIRHTLLGHNLYVSSVHQSFWKNSFAYITEQELQLVLKKHPAWQRQLLLKNAPISALQQQIQSGKPVYIPHIKIDSLYHYLRLAALKECFAVYIDTSHRKPPYIIHEPAENSTLFFPVTMFFKTSMGNDRLGYIHFKHTNYYNKDHRFSQWLIKNRESLQKQVPSIYDNLLEVMLLSDNIYEITETVNSLLNLLKNFNNNLFEVSDILFLNNDDFIH